MLRIGAAKPLVYSRLRRVLHTWLSLRLASSGVAIRLGGGGMVGNRSAAVVACTE